MWFCHRNQNRIFYSFENSVSLGILALHDFNTLGWRVARAMGSRQRAVRSVLKERLERALAGGKPTTGPRTNSQRSILRALRLLLF